MPGVRASKNTRKNLDQWWLEGSYDNIFGGGQFKGGGVRDATDVINGGQVQFSQSGRCMWCPGCGVLCGGWGHSCRLPLLCQGNSRVAWGGEPIDSPASALEASPVLPIDSRFTPPTTKQHLCTCDTGYCTYMLHCLTIIESELVHNWLRYYTFTVTYRRGYMRGWRGWSNHLCTCTSYSDVSLTEPAWDSARTHWAEHQ